MSIINKKVMDKRTGDIGEVLNVSFKYINDGFVILLKVEFYMYGDSEGETLTVSRNFKDVLFV